MGPDTAPLGGGDLVSGCLDMSGCFGKVTFQNTYSICQSRTLIFLDSAFHFWELILYNSQVSLRLFPLASTSYPDGKTQLALPYPTEGEGKGAARACGRNIPHAWVLWPQGHQAQGPAPAGTSFQECFLRAYLSAQFGCRCLPGILRKTDMSPVL